MDARQWQLRGAQEYRAGNLTAAAEAISRAAELEPGNPDYLRNLAQIARERGDRDGAVRWLRAAAVVTHKAPTPEGLNFLAADWLDLGMREDALQAAAAALKLRDNPASRHLIADALRHMPEVPPHYRDLVARAHAEGWLGGETLRAAVALLKRSEPQSAADMAADPLLSAVLRTSPIRDAELERRFTALRRSLLLGPIGEVLWPLAAGMSVQCFLNEYAWGVTTEEQEAVLALLSGERTPESLLKIGACMGLGTLHDAEEIAAREWPAPVQEIIRQQIEEPRQERALRDTIPAVTPIREGVSQIVREMYEANPYPRWRRRTQPRPQPLARVLAAQFPRVRFDPIPNADAPSILIAGCGTGGHALHVAGRYTGAKLLAVDLSLSSLAHAKRKATEAQADNIEFGHADILELGGQFDVVDAAGSVQCMEDPDAAVRHLVSLLRPGGLLRLGLYSQVARRYLEPARELGKQYPHDPDGIRAFRQAILNTDPADPLHATLSAGDFYSTSNCRDLLLHVVEHQHTITDLQRMISDNGLRFAGFVVRPEILADYRRRFPEDAAATDLDNWQAFEEANPSTFRTMYQFWTQKPAT